MALRLTEIRQALADRLATVEMLRAYPGVPGGPVAASSSGLSAAVVMPAEDEYIDYQVTFGSPLAKVSLMVRLYVQAVDRDSARVRLDDLLSSGTGAELSVIDAVHADRTLGSAVQDCVISTARNVSFVEDDGQVSLTGDLDVSVLVRRD